MKGHKQNKKKQKHFCYKNKLKQNKPMNQNYIRNKKIKTLMKVII